MRALAVFAACAHLTAPALPKGFCVRPDPSPWFIYGVVEDEAGTPIETRVDLFLTDQGITDDEHGHSERDGRYSFDVGSGTQVLVVYVHDKRVATRQVIGVKTGATRLDVRIGMPDAPWVDPAIPDCHQP
jgi:hypothetical protein